MPAANISPSLPSVSLSDPKGCGQHGTQKASKATVDIIDIRRAALELNIKEDILSQFHPKSGPRTLPTLLLYNERGLQLFEDVSPANNFLACSKDVDMDRSRTWKSTT